MVYIKRIMKSMECLSWNVTRPIYIGQTKTTRTVYKHKE